MLARVEEFASSMRVDPAADSERRRMWFIDRSKGMIFDGSTKWWTYRAMAIPRSNTDSKNRDGGIYVRNLVYLTCTTIYDNILFDVEHGGFLPPLSSA